MEKGKVEGLSSNNVEDNQTQQPSKPWQSYISDRLPRSLMESTDAAVRSAQTLYHDSSSSLRGFQDRIPEIRLKYANYEDALLNKFKGLKGQNASAPLKEHVQEEETTATEEEEEEETTPTDVLVLSLDELMEKTDNFGSKALIGEGSYGKVYYATLENGSAVALKTFDVSQEQESDDEFLTQVSIVASLKHENIVALQGYCVEGNMRVLAYEFATMGSLHDILHGTKGENGDQPGPVLDWMQRATIAVDAARGVEYLHLSDKSDVYSFGVVLLELLTGRKPVDYTMPDGQQSLVAWATPLLTDDKVKQCVDPRLKDYPAKQAAKLAAVASLCVQYEGDFRPNMSIVVKALQPLLRTPTPVTA